MFRYIKNTKRFTTARRLVFITFDLPITLKKNTS